MENKRFAIFPIKNHDLWEIYKKQQALLWTAEEIDYNDMDDWAKLNSNEQYFIEHILAFFAGSDEIVLENIGMNFMEDIENYFPDGNPEAKMFYCLQEYVETVHSETYSRLIETYVKDPERKVKIFDAINNIDCIRNKALWAMKWMGKDTSFPKRLVAFAIVEGIFFSGAFCSIFWIKNRNLLTKALGTSNEFISRDEGLHTEFAITLYNNYIKKDDKLSHDEIHDIIKEAIVIEKSFIIDSLPCRLIGMNSKLMSEYIEFVADRLAVELGCSKIYNSKNPFDFMENLSLEGKTNFFEKRTTEYSSSTAGKKSEDLEFSLNTDF
jgi:ribonucleoside-diphosphate reductase beta chain